MSRFGQSMLVCSFVLCVFGCGGASAPPAAAPMSPAPMAPAPMAAPEASMTPAAAPMAAEAPAPAPEPAAPPQMVLGETPDDKLGTAPTGFGLRMGDAAPKLTLEDTSAKPVKLASLYAQGPVFVVFYRGGWCPFCNLQLHDLAKAKPEFEKLGVRLVAISVDKPSEEAKTQAAQGVPFPMLSDPDLTAHTAFRVVHVAPAEEREKFKKYGLDLSTYSGKTHGNYAIPSIFLVDRKGTIRFVHVDDDYKTRPSVKQLLDVAAKQKK